jgi:hypothetical protein
MPLSTKRRSEKETPTMKTTILALACCTLAAASCVSEDPALPPTPPPADTGPTEAVPVTPPPSAPPAEKYFIETLHPALMESCGLCHARGAQSAPIWLEARGDDAYDLIQTYGGGKLYKPASANPILSKGEHTGPDLESDEEAYVKTWLGLEFPGQGGGGTVDVDQLFQKYATCGLEDDAFASWQARGLEALPVTVTNGGCNCATCHADADEAFGVFLFNDARQTFDAHSVQPSINMYILTQADQNGSFSGLTPSDRLVIKGEERNNNGQVACDCNDTLAFLASDNRDFNSIDYCHPDYAVADNVRDGLEDFLKEMLGRITTADCSIP